MKKYYFLFIILFLAGTTFGIKKYQDHLFNSEVDLAKKNLMVSEKYLNSFAKNYFKCENKKALEVSINNHELRIRNLIALVPEQYVEIENHWEPIKDALTKQLDSCAIP